MPNTPKTSSTGSPGQRSTRRVKPAWKKAFYILGNIIGVLGMTLLSIGIGIINPVFGFSFNPSLIILGGSGILIGTLLGAIGLDDSEVEESKRKNKEEVEQLHAESQEKKQKSENELELTQDHDPVEEFNAKVRDLKQDDRGVAEYRSLIESCLKTCPNILQMYSKKTHLTILHTEVKNNRSQFVALILAFGLDVNITTPYESGQETPLMLAARYLHVNLVRMLLVLKPNLEQRDKDGRTAIEHCFTHMSLIARPKGSKEELKEILKLLLQAGASVENTKVENIKPDHKRHCGVVFTAPHFKQFDLIPIFLEHAKDLNLQARNPNNDTLLMMCFNFHYTDGWFDLDLIKQLIDRLKKQHGQQSVLDEINQVDSVNLLSALHHLLNKMSHEKDFFKNLIDMLTQKKIMEIIKIIHNKENLFPLRKILINAAIEKEKQNKQGKKKSILVKPKQNPKSKAKFRVYNMDRKPLSEAEQQLKEIEGELLLFYPKEIEDGRKLLEKIKGQVLALQLEFERNRIINKRECQSNEENELRLKRLAENEIEAEKIKSILNRIKELEPKLELFKKRFDIMAPKIQDFSKEKNYNRVHIIMKRLSLWWKNSETGIAALLKKLDIQHKALKFSAEEWMELNRKESKYKRKESAGNSSVATQAMRDSSFSAASVESQDLKDSKETKEAKAKEELEKQQELLKKMSGRYQKREQAIERRTKREERLERFDSEQRRKREEAAAWLGDLTVQGSPSIKPDAVTAEGSPKLKPSSLTADSSPKLPSSSLTAQGSPVLRPLRGPRSPSINSLVEHKNVAEEFQVSNGSRPVNNAGTGNGGGLNTRGSYSPPDRSVLTFERATQLGKRTEMMQEVMAIQKALKYDCPKSCNEQAYQQYDAYGILLVCAQAMHSLDQRQQAIFPEKMANQFRNAIYKGELFRDEDLIKRHQEIREMAQAMMNFISERCKLLQGSISEEDVFKKLGSPIFSEIMNFQIPKLHLQTSEEYREICKRVMTSCSMELERISKFKQFMTADKWKAAFFLLNARLGAHFAHFKKYYKKDRQYTEYDQKCRKYRRLGTLIRHNENRPVSAPSAQRVQDDDFDLDTLTQMLAANASISDRDTAFPSLHVVSRGSTVGSLSLTEAENLESAAGRDNSGTDSLSLESGTVLFSLGMRRNYNQNDQGSDKIREGNSPPR